MKLNRFAKDVMYDSQEAAEQPANHSANLEGLLHRAPLHLVSLPDEHIEMEMLMVADEPNQSKRGKAMKNNCYSSTQCNTVY